mgnify:CR=1 FL=1
MWTPQVPCRAVDQVGEHRRLQSCGVGVDQQEPGIFGQKLHGQGEEGPEAFFQFPGLSFWAPAVGGRIHDDAFVPVSPAQFPLHKFDTVVHQRPPPAKNTTEISLQICPMMNGRIHYAQETTEVLQMQAALHQPVNRDLFCGGRNMPLLDMQAYYTRKSSARASGSGSRVWAPVLWEKVYVSTAMPDIAINAVKIPFRLSRPEYSHRAARSE